MMKSKSTFVLIAINTIIFGWMAVQQQSILMNSNVDALAILRAGANLNPFTLGGEPWRIFTSMFLHYGIIHLAANMYGLYSLGQVLEPAIGTPRFLLVYFLCGIASGLASLFFNVFVISAGASGAIFGIYGYMLGAQVIGNIGDREKLKMVVVNFIIFVVINALITSQFSVDLAGHIGGCIMGVILSVFHFKMRWFVDNKALAAAFVLLPFLMLVLPKGQVQYYQIFQRVVQAEKSTNKWFNNATSDQALKDSLVTILPEWDSIQSSIRSLSHIPEELSADTTALKRYAFLNRKRTEYRIKMVERESYIYYDSLDIINSDFEALQPFKYIPNYSLSEAEPEPKPDPKPQHSYEQVRIFYDSVWKETNNPSASSFFRDGSRDSIGRWQGRVYDYYQRSGKVQMKGAYKDDLNHGVFIYYSERGTYQSAGRYEKGRSVGKWERFHWNGKMREEVFYGNGGFTRNTWDSLGRPQVVNGNGRSTTWFDNGRVSEEGNYENGKREDYWRGFHRDGTPYYEDLYRSNRLVRGVSITKEGKRFVYDELSEFPMPTGGMPAFRKYVIWNMKKDPSWKGGLVKVIFDVGVDGSMWDFVILESECTDCNAEAIRLVKEGPPWLPGVLHGHVKIQGQGYVEIAF